MITIQQAKDLLASKRAGQISNPEIVSQEISPQTQPSEQVSGQDPLKVEGSNTWLYVIAGVLAVAIAVVLFIIFKNKK